MAGNIESYKLSERCEALKGDMSVDNEAWKRFVMDHKRYLLSKSTKLVLDVHEMLKYKYRPFLFVEDKLEQVIESTWIFMYINDINGVMDFNESISSVMVYDQTVLDDLWRLFESANNEE